MTIPSRINSAQDVVLCLVRKWWRPATCIGIAGGTIINFIVLPLRSGQWPDMTAGALWIGAATAAFGVRAFEKWSGKAE